MSQPAQPVPASNADTASPKSKVAREQGGNTHDSQEPQALLTLLASRLSNALVIQTFFQPDEYFQALEPAWGLAFGSGSGAWITWEWRHHLRSAIHPALFAVCYRIADFIASLLNLSKPLRAEVLLAAPKILQACIAALGDYYTWKLAGITYGPSSLATAVALNITIGSPWQWFCSTRTFSNCLEMTLTAIALYNWPWHWSNTKSAASKLEVDTDGLRIRDVSFQASEHVEEVTRLRRALLCAAFATILRPTNILIWFVLTLMTFLRRPRINTPPQSMKSTGSQPANTDVSILAPTRKESFTFIRETLLCGGAMLLLSAFVDRMFYQAWVFPPYNFLYFNVVQSLAIFYGNNNWHYYISQGYPLLLTTMLPFALIGIYQALSSTQQNTHKSPTTNHILQNLAIISIFVPTVLSIISHKEVRFIYTILPALHVLASYPASTFFGPALRRNIVPTSTNHHRLPKRLLLLLILVLNLTISLYTSQAHNSGLISVTHYLRHQFETHYLNRPEPIQLPMLRAPRIVRTNMTVGFLMPCHSTPWRSHLQYAPTSHTPGIDAWALTCEPPLNLNSTQKRTYLDEADQFYADPEIWLKRHMSRHPPPSLKDQHAPGIHAAAHGAAGGAAGGGGGSNGPRARRMFEVETHEEEDLWRDRNGRRPWPEYLLFFEQLEPVMKGLMRGSKYTECRRIWNSRVHDDWRRTGDVVVWCLYPNRRLVVSDKEGKGGRGLDGKRGGIGGGDDDDDHDGFVWGGSLWDRVGGMLGLTKREKTVTTIEDIQDAIHNPNREPRMGLPFFGQRVMGGGGG